MEFKQVNQRALAPLFDITKEDVSAVVFTESQAQKRLEVIAVPDVRDKVDVMTGDNLDPSVGGYYVLTREPKTMTPSMSGSPMHSNVLDINGPFAVETLVQSLVQTDQDVPVFDKYITLRPANWDAPNDWLSCQQCRDSVSVSCSLTSDSLTLECDSCSRSVTNDTDGSSMRLFEDWAHCPSCGSGDIQIEISVPRGNTNFSCDDCLYDTLPNRIDSGFSEQFNGLD